MVKKRPTTAAAALPVRSTITPRVNGGESNGHATIPAENLQFGSLCEILEPVPTIRYPIWIHHIDRHEKAVLFYQLDLKSKPPCMRKSLQIRSRAIPLASGPRNVLVPVAHIDAIEVPIGIIKDKIGRSYISNAADVQTILEFLHNSSRQDILQNHENLEIVRVATTAATRTAPKTSRKRPISSDRGSDDEDDEQRSQLAASEYSTSASRRSEVSRPSVIARGPRASSDAGSSSARKPGKRRQRLTMPKKKPRPRPKTTHEIRVTSPPSFTPARLAENGAGPSKTQVNGEPDSHGTTSSHDQPTRPVTSFANGDTVESKLVTQELILPRVVKFREIVCNELGIPVEGDIPPVEPKVMTKVRKIMTDVCQLKPDQTWKSGTGAAVKFGLRPARVWHQFSLMYQILKSDNKLDQIKMSYVRDFLNRVSDDEAIRVLRECTEQMSGDPLRRAARLRIQAVTGTRVGPVSKSVSGSVPRDTEDEAMEWDDSGTGAQ